MIATFSPFALGGVLGSVKLNTPNTAEAIAVITNVFLSIPDAIESCESHPNAKLINKPATIHPMVPHTRMNGKSFEGSFI